MMDKIWASFNPFTEDYRTGLAKFISNSLEVASHEGNIKCPCAKCLNRFWLSNKKVEAHLIVEGMDRSYLQGLWVWHGQTFGDPLPSSEAAQQLAAVNTPHSKLGPLLEDIFSGPSVMGGMPTNNHNEQETPIPAYARDPSATDDLVALANGPRKWCRRYKIFDVEHATGDNDEVRVRINVNAQDFEEFL
ncbi:unnamed protein product [Malus baccata var. baccata]